MVLILLAAVECSLIFMTGCKWYWSISSISRDRKTLCDMNINEITVDIKWLVTSLAPYYRFLGITAVGGGHETGGSGPVLSSGRTFSSVIWLLLDPLQLCYQSCVQGLHGAENTCSGCQRSIRPRSRPWGPPVGNVKDPHSQSGVWPLVLELCDKL